jgi:hypothetical protein
MQRIVRVTKETGLTTDQVTHGVATRELGVPRTSGSGSGSVQFIGVETGTKGKAD